MKALFLSSLGQEELRRSIQAEIRKEQRNNTVRHGNGNGGGGISAPGSNRFVSKDEPVDLVTGMQAGWKWRS